MLKKAQVLTPTTQLTVFAYVRGHAVNWLLLFLPVSMVLAGLHAAELAIFLTAALAIIPLAGAIGSATEALAARVGPGIGGLLNATFGNATEFIIAIVALQAGLVQVVKASISGSIIGNLLLVIGVSMFAGGWGRERQTFNRVHAGASAAMLVLAVIALVMPAVFDLTVNSQINEHLNAGNVQALSLLVAVVMLCIYGASLIFSLKTHREIFDVDATPARARLNIPNALTLLITATVLTAVESELLVGAIGHATQALGMTEFFVGVIVVAIIGNAAEHFSAIDMARRNQMDLAMTIGTASSTQIALFVAPILVFLSYLIGHPMTLVFNVFEVVGIGLAVLIMVVVSLDGESNWFEGLQLVAVYLILAIVFFFVPKSALANAGRFTAPPPGVTIVAPPSPH